MWYLEPVGAGTSLSAVAKNGNVSARGIA